MTMSASATQWNAPPAQMPFTAVITGFQTSFCHAVKCRSHCSTDSRYRSIPCPSVASSVTSTPVWNARPSPVWTITRTSGSLSSAFHAISNSSRICAFIALSCSGRLLINQPTGPTRSNFSVSRSGYVIRRLPCSPSRAASRSNARGPSSWSGWPHMPVSSAAPFRQASVRPDSSAPHSARFVAAIAAGEFCAIVSPSCWAVASSSSGSTTWEQMPSSYARAAVIRSCVPMSAMRRIASIGDFFVSAIVSYTLT